MEALKDSKIKGYLFQQQNYVPGIDNPTGQDPASQGAMTRPGDGNIAIIPKEIAEKEGDKRM